MDKMLFTRTFGILPTRKEYDLCWKKSGPAGKFAFGNDPRIGTCELTQDELWEEILRAHKDWSECSNEDAGNFLSCVLNVLGFEWV